MMRDSRVVICLVVLVFAASAAVAERPEPEIHGTFDGEPMYTVLPPNAIPAITEPTYLTGKAAEAQMSPDESVIGVTLNGESLCWSTWQLDGHEIVNDVIAGTAIAATW